MFSTIKELIDHPGFVDLVDEKLRELIEEQPEFTYRKEDISGCYYDKGPDSDPGKCDGCLFGQAFQKMGIPKSELGDQIGVLIEVYNEAGTIPAISQFPGVPHYWSNIQDAQDSGTKWGDLLQYLPAK